MSERTCVKVSNLREKYNDKSINFKKWIENTDNVYIGRRGRIFINKEIYVYQGSIWSNPYRTKFYGLEKCLEMYEEYIKCLIKESKCDINMLKDKNLGCFCNEDEKCHADILIKILNENKI